MASAYSFLADYNQPLYTPDLGLIAQVGAMKQQKLDFNRAKLQSVLDNYKNLDVIKSEDKEYLATRLNTVKDMVNKYANQDLSSTGLTNALQQDLGQILDSKVKNAVASTAIYKSEVTQWDEFAKKKPELFNQTNKAYAFTKSGASDWLQDGTAGSSYNGGATVIPYTDVKANVNKNLPNYLKSFGIEKTKTYTDVDGSEYFVKESTGEKVTKDTVMKGLNAMLSSQDKQQLQIDSWGTFRGTPDDKVKELFSSFNRGKTSENNQKLDYINKLIKTGNLNSSQLKQANESRQSLIDNNNLLKNSTFDDIGRTQAENLLFMDSFENDFANAYSFDREIDSKLNDYKLQEKKFLLDVEELKLKTNEFKLKKDLAEAKAKQEAGVTTDDLQTVNKVTTPDAEINLIDEATTDYQTSVNSILKNQNLVDPSLVGKDINELSQSERQLLFQNIESLSTKNMSPEESKVYFDYLSKKGQKEAIANTALEGVESVIDKYTSAFRESSEDVSNLPRPKFKVTLDKEGNEVLETVSDDSENPFKDVVTKIRQGGKESLTNEELKSYNLYMMHYMTLEKDNKIPEVEKNIIKDTFNAVVRDYKGGEALIKGQEDRGTGGKDLVATYLQEYKDDANVVKFLQNMDNFGTEPINTIDKDKFDLTIAKIRETGEQPSFDFNHNYDWNLWAQNRVEGVEFKDGTVFNFNVDDNAGGFDSYSNGFTEFFGTTFTSDDKLSNLDLVNENGVELNTLYNEGAASANSITRTIEEKLKNFKTLNRERVLPFSSEKLNDNQRARLITSIQETYREANPGVEALSIDDLDDKIIRLERNKEGQNVVSVSGIVNKKIAGEDLTLNLNGLAVPNITGSGQIIKQTGVKEEFTPFNSSIPNAPNLDIKLKIQSDTDIESIIDDASQNGIDLSTTLLRFSNSQDFIENIPEDTEIQKIKKAVATNVIDSYRKGDLTLQYTNVPGKGYTPILTGNYINPTTNQVANIEYVVPGAGFTKTIPQRDFEDLMTNKVFYMENTLLNYLNTNILR